MKRPELRSTIGFGLVMLGLGAIAALFLREWFLLIAAAGILFLAILIDEMLIMPREIEQKTIKRVRENLQDQIEKEKNEHHCYCTTHGKARRR